MTDRPRKATPEMLMEAALATAKELAGISKIEQSEIEQCAKDIAKHGRPYGDGYQLAKLLEDYEHWDPDFEMAEILEGFGYAAQKCLEAAEKKWALENNVQPPLPVGAKVKIKGGETGEITGVYEHGAAKFLVKIDGDPNAVKTNSRRIVNFEDALTA